MKAAAARACATCGSELSESASAKGGVSVPFVAAFFLERLVEAVESDILTSPSASAFRLPCFDCVDDVRLLDNAVDSTLGRGILGVGESVDSPRTAFRFVWASSQPN